MTKNSLLALCVLLAALATDDGFSMNFNKPKPLVVDSPPVSFLFPETIHEQCKAVGDYNFEAESFEYVTSAHNREVMPIQRSIQDVLVLALNPNTRDIGKFKTFVNDFVNFLRAGNFRGVRDRQNNMRAGSWHASGHSPDPGFGAQSLLYTAAQLVSVADALDAWSTQSQREFVISWGNNLQQESHRDRRGRTYSQQMNDNVAMRAKSYLAWSLVSGVSSLRLEAEKAFDNVLNRLNSDGSMTDWLDNPRAVYRKHLALKEDDKAVGHLIVAANLASNIDEDWYAKRSRKKQTLDDAVGWLVTAHTKPESTKQASKLKSQARISTGMQLGDWSWTTIYIADRSATPQGKKLRELSKKFEGLGYWNRHLGYTSCYHGYVGDGLRPVDPSVAGNAPLQLNTSKSEACSDPTFAALMGASCD